MSSLSPKDRSRSPRFPNQSLEESLKHARMIYDGVHRSTIDSGTAFRLMGFVGKTGTSSKALGSLRQYGLIEGTGENTRISDLSLAILEPESESERATSIIRAARSPDVFESILIRFGDRVPQADEPIRAFLIRELGFQKNSADECIKSLRQSLAYSENFSGLIASESAPPSAEEETEVTPALQKQKLAPDRVELLPTQSANIPLTRECHAELNIYGPLSEKAVSNLIKHIQLLSEVWAEE
jgi:hypothetical protein